MGRYQLTFTVMTGAVLASGCGSGSAPERSATRVLRPDEVRITLGTPPTAVPKPDAPAAQSEGDAKP